MNSSFVSPTTAKLLNNVISLSFLHPAFSDPEYLQILQNLVRHTKKFAQVKVQKSSTLPLLSKTRNIPKNNSLPQKSSLQKFQNTKSELYYWLKTHRLHKYAGQLCNLSTEQLQNLTHAELKNFNITVGAQNKLLGIIEKLKCRNTTIQNLVITKSGLKDSLLTMKESLEMPSDKISGQLLQKLVGKAFDVLSTGCDKHCEIKFVEIIELCKRLVYLQKSNSNQ